MSTPTFAANIQGPKRGALEKLQNGDAVRKRVLLREKRFAISPTLGFTLNDAFQRSALLGLQLEYHLSDAFSIGANGLYGIATNSALGERVSVARPTQFAKGGFTGINLKASAEAAYRPLFGKLALFGRKAVNYDFHVLAGAGIVGLEGPPESAGTAPMGVLGVGMRFFVDESMALTVQVRDYIFSSALNAVVNPLLFGTDDARAESEIHNNFALTIGYGFFFPRKPRVSD